MASALLTLQYFFFSIPQSRNHLANWLSYCLCINKKINEETALCHVTFCSNNLISNLPHDKKNPKSFKVLFEINLTEASYKCWKSQHASACSGCHGSQESIKTSRLTARTDCYCDNKIGMCVLWETVASFSGICIVLFFKSFKWLYSR